jgi:hypothetical protein
MSHLTLNQESITTLVHEFYDAIRAEDAAEFQTVSRRIAASLQYGFFGEVKVA